LKIDEMAHTFVIAEAGVNHNGDTELAKQLTSIFKLNLLYLYSRTKFCLQAKYSKKGSL